jgi:hypothetical protein
MLQPIMQAAVFIARNLTVNARESKGAGLGR